MRRLQIQRKEDHNQQLPKNNNIFYYYSIGPFSILQIGYVTRLLKQSEASLHGKILK